MNRQEEEFVHLVRSIQDLNEAWRILKAIQESEEQGLLIGASFMYALIAYARPFKPSRGSVLNEKGKGASHRLDNCYVPRRYRRLHATLLGRRDQVLAHSDLTVREARLHVTQFPDRREALIIENIVHGAEDIDHLDDIIRLVEGTLDNLYRQERQIEAQLLATECAG